MPTPAPIFLAGKFVITKDTYEVHSPYDDSVVATVCRATTKEVEIALKSAVVAFEQTRIMEAYERAEVLRKVADGLQGKKEELAKIMASEAGKPLAIGRNEVDRATLTFRDAAEEAVRPEAEYLDLSRGDWLAGRRGLVRRFPMGIVYGIAPFNFPLNLVAHKVAPAIACGCPIILKPSSATPLTALKLAEIIDRAAGDQLPAGAVSVLPMNREVGDSVNHDERVKLISFTGSDAVGYKIQASVPKRKTVMELGGNAAVVVTDSADVTTAVDKINIAAFASAGQSCISVQRMYIHESIYDKLKAELIEKTNSLKCGDPLAEDTTVGPLINAKNAERVEGWLKQAVDQGGRLLTGGEREGNIIRPAILEDVPATCSVVKEEVFAPVAVLERYSDLTKVTAEINSSRYGLQAGIFSDSFDEIFRFYREVEAGGVLANDVPTFRADPQPYGGVKDSGHGREGVKYAIRDMTEERILIWQEKI